MIPSASRRAIDEVIDLLVTLARERVPPDRAEERFGQLRARHPDTGLELVARTEGYSGAVHYDALVRTFTDDTLVLSWCSDRGVPWLVRSARHLEDNAVVSVNGVTLYLQEACALLDPIWNEARVATWLVDAVLLRIEVVRHNIVVSDEEAQSALDSFRSEHELFTVDETQAWLAKHGIDHAQLERRLSHGVAVGKLREQVATDLAVEDTFHSRRDEFMYAYVTRARFARAGDASAVREEITSGRRAFLDAVWDFFAANNGRDGHVRFAVERRGSATPGEAAIFEASPGEVVGPIDGPEGYELICVREVRRAALDDSVRAQIREQLFMEWLSHLRRQAVVRWNWGNPRIAWTAPASDP